MSGNCVNNQRASIEVDKQCEFHWQCSRDSFFSNGFCAPFIMLGGFCTGDEDCIFGYVCRNYGWCYQQFSTETGDEADRDDV